MRKLILFVRAPRPGLVKTRLAASIGAEAAARAYRLIAETVLDRVASLPHVQIRYAPDDAKDEIRDWLREGWLSSAQGAGDLGQRMHVAFADAFAAGISRVVLIGSDCPGITVEDIEASWSALDTNDLVIGPASDGGYWLIALRQPQPALFENIPWSTNVVLSQTLARAQATGLHVHLLRELTDIDTEREWLDFLNSTTPARSGSIAQSSEAVPPGPSQNL